MIGKHSLRLCGIFLATVCVASLTACAPPASAPVDSEASSRSAVGKEGGGECFEKTSFQRRLTITNNLNVPVRMETPLQQLDCASWSGVDTPARYNGKIIQSGESVSLRYEIAWTAGKWTQTFKLLDGTTIADLKLKISKEFLDDDWIFKMWDGASYAWDSTVSLNQDGGYAYLNDGSLQTLTLRCKTQVAGCK